jgi:NTP pyrophosphatase (non-canonical NTP hydrolase)
LTPSEYQKLAELTENKDFEGIAKRLTRDVCRIRLDHAQKGLCTEVGEFTDALKKYVEYDAPLDYVNLAEEIGDLMWYIALACNALDIRLEDVMSKNIKKLEARYPDKFTSKDALLRNLDQERKVLEDHDNSENDE